jgi:hypothetical protein
MAKASTAAGISTMLTARANAIAACFFFGFRNLVQTVYAGGTASGADIAVKSTNIP